MTKAEAMKQWESGGRVLNVQYVVSKAENIMCRNKLNPGGARVARPVVKHSILIGNEMATVTDWMEEGFAVESYKAPYKQMERYLLVFQSWEVESGNISIRGKLEPITPA